MRELSCCSQINIVLTPHQGDFGTDRNPYRKPQWVEMQSCGVQFQLVYLWDVLLELRMKTKRNGAPWSSSQQLLHQVDMGLCLSSSMANADLLDLMWVLDKHAWLLYYSAHSLALPFFLTFYDGFWAFRIGADKKILFRGVCINCCPLKREVSLTRVEISTSLCLKA